MTIGRSSYGGYRPESIYNNSDREPRATDGMALLQWANAWIAEDEDGQQVIYSGFVIPLKRTEDLDKILKKAGWKIIKKDQGQGSNSYWTFTSLDGVRGGANLFAVTLGLDTSDNMVNTTERKGWGYGFHPTGGTNDRGKPLGIGKLNTIVFVAELFLAGYDKPVLLTAAKMTALSLNTVAIRNYLALDMLNETLIKQATAKGGDGSNIPYPEFYRLAVPVVPGKAKKVGEGRESGTIAPPWSGLPEKAQFEDPKFTKAWIGKRYIMNPQFSALLDLIEVASEDSTDGLSLLDKSIENSTSFATAYAKKGEDWWKSENGGDTQAAPAAKGAAPAAAAAAEDDGDEEMWGAPPARPASPARAKPVGTADGVGNKATGRRAAAVPSTVDSDEDIPF